MDGGGGFEGGDADGDESPVEEEGDSELEDEGPEFSVGSSFQTLVQRISSSSPLSYRQVEAVDHQGVYI